jgi:7-carboxy-7-deazaguanine synthase
MKMEEMAPTTLTVVEIFDSISGEVNGFNGIGQISTFIRLGGCNLKCRWCDTLYAQSIQHQMVLELEDIQRQVVSQHVTITGGEPLLQEHAVVDLITNLTQAGHQVTVETNGSVIPSPALLALPCVLMMDFKLPSSQEMARMNMQAFSVLRPEDWVKFVCKDNSDFQHAILTLETWSIGANHIAFSPCVESELDLAAASNLCQSMLAYVENSAEKRRLHFSLQMHKLLGVR